MSNFPPQHSGYPNHQPPPAYPPSSYPPYVQPPPPPRKSRVGWYILLAGVAMFGACGALVAFLPEVPESGPGADEPAGETAGEPAGEPAGESDPTSKGEDAAPKGALRKDVPADAAKTIKKARDALRAKDFDALRSVLASGDAASYRIDDELEAKTSRAAIAAWRKDPKMLERMDAALAAKCEVDPPEEGQILISCGDDRSGSVYVILSNMMDEAQSEREFLIYSVGEIL